MSSSVRRRLVRGSVFRLLRQSPLFFVRLGRARDGASKREHPRRHRRRRERRRRAPRDALDRHPPQHGTLGLGTLPGLGNPPGLGTPPGTLGRVRRGGRIRGGVRAGRRGKRGRAIDHPFPARAIRTVVRVKINRRAEIHVDVARVRLPGVVIVGEGAVADVRGAGDDGDAGADASGDVGVERGVARLGGADEDFDGAAVHGGFVSRERAVFEERVAVVDGDRASAAGPVDDGAIVGEDDAAGEERAVDEDGAAVASREADGDAAGEDEVGEGEVAEDADGEVSRGGAGVQDARGGRARAADLERLVHDGELVAAQVERGGEGDDGRGGGGGHVRAEVGEGGHGRGRGRRRRGRGRRLRERAPGGDRRVPLLTRDAGDRDRGERDRAPQGRQDARDARRREHDRTFATRATPATTRPRDESHGRAGSLCRGGRRRNG